MKKTRFIVYAAIIAALYFVLTELQNLLLPGTTSMAIQFRASEALCVFALFTPAAIPGLTLGCILVNLFNAGTLPLDFILGSGATLVATSCMYLLRNVKIKTFPLPALLMPAVWNALLVGIELTIYIEGTSFGINAGYVALGELGVLFTLGVVLYYVFSTRKLNERLFGR